VSDAPHRAFHPRGSPWLITFVVTMAPFMEVLDSTIVNVCLPNIAGGLSASFDEATWTLTSYLVANGMVVPVAGWLARLIGRKRYFLICIASFTVLSFLCGIATSLEQLVLFRLLQGLCGGGLQPNQQSILLDTFEPSQRSRGFSMVAIAVIFAPIIGPTLGGWITDSYSWHWVFLINVPIGLFSFISVWRLVEDPPWVVSDHAFARDIDYVGLALIAVGLGSLQLMLDRGQELDWFDSSFIRFTALIAAATLGGAIAWLLMIDKPVVNLRALADRNFAVGSITVFSIGAVLYSSNVLIPLLAQGWFGYTAYTSGLLMSPGATVMVVLIPVGARWILPNVPTKWVLAFGFTMLGASSAYASHLAPMMDFWTLASFRALQTVGLAFLFVPNSTLSYSTMPRALNPDATALYSMFRNIGGSIGISVATAITASNLQVHRAYLSQHLSPLEAPFLGLQSRYEQTLRTLGYSHDTAHGLAMGLIDRTLNLQSAVLAYSDVFAWSAAAAFCVVPLTFLFRSGIADRAKG
jgi:MFS transporter, DHA2 family, multidrug resistance protein